MLKTNTNKKWQTPRDISLKCLGENLKSQCTDDQCTRGTLAQLISEPWIQFEEALSLGENLAQMISALEGSWPRTMD